LIVNRYDFVEMPDVAADRRLEKIRAVANPHKGADARIAP